MSPVDGALRPWLIHMRLRLRCERAWLIALPVGVLLLTAALSPSYGRTFASRADQQQVATQARANDTMMLLYGRLDSEADAVEIAVWELGAMTCLVLGIVIVLRAAAVSRGEEDQGRAELLHAACAGPVPRVIVQAALLGILSALVGSAAGAGLLALQGAGAADARSYGVAVGLTCLLLAATTQVGAQLAADAAGTRAVGMTVLAASFLAYGLDCAKDWRWSGLAAAASPFRLREDLAAGEGDDWTPCLWALAAWILLTGVAAVMARRRDLGQGLVSVRPPWMRMPLRAPGPAALALWLSARSMITWALAVGATAGLFTDMGRSLVELARQDGLSSDSEMGSLLGSSSDPGEAFLAYLGSLLGVLAACQAVSLASRAGAEELSGRIEAVAATGVTTVRTILAWWMTALVSSGLTLACAAGAAATVGEDALGTGSWDALRLVAGQWPAAIAAAGLASFVCAARPRWRGLAWIPVLASLGITQFGASLDLPEGIRDANPAAQAGEIGSWWLLGMAVVLIASGILLHRRRDLMLAGTTRPGLPHPGLSPIHPQPAPSRG